jgi:hypothetical protein
VRTRKEQSSGGWGGLFLIVIATPVLQQFHWPRESPGAGCGVTTNLVWGAPSTGNMPTAGSKASVSLPSVPFCAFSRPHYLSQCEYHRGQRWQCQDMNAGAYCLALNWTPPLPNCVNLSKLLYHSVPLATTPLKIWDNSTVFPIGC